MILCLDAGNSRLKWGMADAAGWRAQGALEWAQLAGLESGLATYRPQAAFLASVVDKEKEAALLDALGGLPTHFLNSAEAAGGVQNGYARPATLGIDRWCSLIGARALESRPCLVVTAGTATTLDALDGEGRFLGGMILPGVAMMQAALAEGTARLPLIPEENSLPAGSAFPTDTASAIAAGCLEASAGAIERAFARLPEAAVCLLSGGAAPLLAPLLSRLPLRLTPQLALEGVRRLALQYGETR
ncbi:MAG: type III pantothenate kinase [Zoogloeaceae bacterium]|jgi:type III pantothenate kinase|nr:type III pantothenate kinase [Zoogloeaceae bacterium]